MTVLTAVLSNTVAALFVGGSLLAPVRAFGASRVLMFSVLFIANILLSNIALHAVSVSAHQVIRSTVPVFSAAIGFGFGYRVPTTRLLALLPICGGVALACYHKDTQTSHRGVLLTLLSAGVCACIKILAPTPSAPRLNQCPSGYATAT